MINKEFLNNIYTKIFFIIGFLSSSIFFFRSSNLIIFIILVIILSIISSIIGFKFGKLLKEFKTIRFIYLMTIIFLFYLIYHLELFFL